MAESEYSSKLNILRLDASKQKLASNFSCGNTYIDSFLKSPQALDYGFGKTYIWLDESNSHIIGFYNISVGCIDQCDDGCRYKIGGSLHINEFALDTRYQGKCVSERLDIRLSDLLLQDCRDRANYLRGHHVGFSFITLQSTNEGHGLYSRNGFEDIEEDMTVSSIPEEENCRPMYLPLDLEE